MLRKNAWIGLLLLVVFLPANLLAQEMMHGKWWRDKSIIQELGLTDREEKVLEEKYIESRRKMINLKSEIEKHRFELDLLLGAKDMDKQEIMERYDSLEQARAELSKVRFEMLLDVRETIGVERFQDLKFMHRDRDRRDRDRKETKRSRRDRYSYRDREWN
ncbi:MAG: hypothetical protein AMJ60_01470 [Desulfobacterales bacterium SG8_35]|nr:MAG: hypothetical protein AMJ60_01470 [Desulfobacterales bacterium SG8_35]